MVLQRTVSHFVLKYFRMEKFYGFCTRFMSEDFEGENHYQKFVPQISIPQKKNSKNCKKNLSVNRNIKP